ncbi:PIR protein, putative [Plasmodium sp.]|nr:PIR protein, putative [Plasmodium sp.]
MKLHYSKILLFSLPLNILVSSSSNAHNNKPYIKAHTATTTWRVLSESDPYMPNYDNDADMKYVKENFNRQTSQRFEEYEERMKRNRQKYKEQCEKDIQKIIEKDKMERSFAEKIERGCLKCGCGLGGVAASVGLFGGLGAYGWKSAATATAIAEGAAAAKAAGEAVRIPATIDAIISGLEQMGISILNGQPLKTFFSTINYTNTSIINGYIQSEYSPSSCFFDFSGARETFCTWVNEKLVGAANVQRSGASTNALVKKTVETIVSGAPKAAETAVEAATKEAIKASTDAVESTYAICQTAIIASVVALLIIVLVMIIIYLVLRYRRKKKMNKKAQYTKLLNQ